MSPKKIVQVLYSGLGGHGSVAYSLIEANNKNLLFSLVYFGIEPLNEGYVEMNAQLGVAYNCIQKKPGADLMSWVRYYQLLKKQKPATVLLHSITLLIPTLIYKWLNRCNVVAVEHNANQIKRKSEWWWSKWANRYCDKVIYLSADYLEEVKAHLGTSFKVSKATVIPNGINTNKFQPALLKGPAADSLRLFMHSRFTSFRDHPTLLKAVALLANEYTQLELVLAGDGVTKPAIEQLASDLGISEKVIFTGTLNENELIAELQKCAIFTYCSNAETMSTAIMQAMACGLPIVTSDIRGINNLIEGGKTGILVAPGQPQAMANAIRDLILDESKKMTLKQNARAFAVKSLSNQQMFSSYYSVI